jgi:hypothetical protein
MELAKIDGANDPFEGSNVSLSCRTYQNSATSTPPKWSYQINGNGKMQIIDEINPPEGLKFIRLELYYDLHKFQEIQLNHSGIQITKDKFDYSSKTLYENQLYISDISSNAYTFRCQGSGFTENISFLAIGS